MKEISPREVEEGFKGAGEVLSKSSQRLSTWWRSRFISTCSWFSLSLLPRRNWVTADSGAASSRRNGKGSGHVSRVLLHGTERWNSAGHLGPAVPSWKRDSSSVLKKSQSLIGMCWMCSEQAAQPGPWVSSCMETCPSYEFQHWGRQAQGCPTWGGCGHVKGRISCILRC